MKDLIAKIIHWLVSSVAPNARVCEHGFSKDDPCDACDYAPAAAAATAAPMARTGHPCGATRKEDCECPRIGEPNG